MLNVDPQLLKNVTNITIRDVVKDFSDVFGRLVTRNNVKVSYLRFFFLNFILPVLFMFFIDSCIRCTSLSDYKHAYVRYCEFVLSVDRLQP